MYRERERERESYCAYNLPGMRCKKPLSFRLTDLFSADSVRCCILGGYAIP